MVPPLFLLNRHIVLDHCSAFHTFPKAKDLGDIILPQWPFLGVCARLQLPGFPAPEQRARTAPSECCAGVESMPRKHLVGNFSSSQE